MALCVTSLFVQVFLLLIIVSDYVSSSSNIDDEDFLDNKSFFAHSFKMQLKPYSEDCVWQRLKVGTYMSFGYEVLRGGNKKIIFSLRDVNGGILQKEEEKEELFIERNIETDVTYGFCMENQDGKFVEKLVFFYLSGYISQEWEMTESEIRQYDEEATKINSRLSTVDSHVQQMKNHQMVSRMHLVADWYIISGNLQWVTYWSAIQGCVIGFVGFFQVYFIKRFFNPENSGSSVLLRERA